MHKLVHLYAMLHKQVDNLNNGEHDFFSFQIPGGPKGPGPDFGAFFCIILSL